MNEIPSSPVEAGPFSDLGGDPWAAQAQAQLQAATHPAEWVNPTPSGPYDLLIIGGGPAGVAAATAAAERGAKVGLIEGHHLGGTSLMTGSVPSKTIIRSSRLYADMRRAEKFGAAAPSEIPGDFALAMARMRRLRARISGYHSAERLKLIGIDVFFGHAEFSGRDRLTVADQTLTFRKAIICTGAKPAPARIPGLEIAGGIDSEQVFNLTKRPNRLLVIGGGPLGCEIAQSFRRLGAHVAIAQNDPKFLPMEERDAAQLLSESLARDGVEIHLNTTVLAIRLAETGEKLVDMVTDSNAFTIAVDEIVTGVGRAPRIEGLCLDKAGVAHHPVRGVVVNDRLRTSNPRIYAAGDVCLEHKFTHVATASARLAVDNALFGRRRKVSALIIPWCTYTDPEVAHVGLYVSECRERGIPVRTITMLMHDAHRAIIDGEEKGFVKIHVRDGTDQILGATIVASHAGDMINEITLAMEARIGLSRLAKVIHAYPTQANAIHEAAVAFVKSRQPGIAAHTIVNPPWPTE